MKKVLQAMSKYIFAAFGVAVLGLLMSLTYSALARVFPDNLVNRLWGLTMFDIAAIAWALAFVFASESVGQYASAGIGFVVAFVGTLGMVAAEVVLSSGAVQPGNIQQWMVYGFIVVTALHAALLYAHHATAPDIHEKINVGIARGEIVTEAIRQATVSLEEQKASLAHTIHADIVSQVKRDLGLLPVNGTPFEPKPKNEPKTYEQTSFLPVLGETQKNPYALPCGHTQGCRNDWETGMFVCKVCGAPFDVRSESQKREDEGANAPAPFRGGDGIQAGEK